MKNKILLYILLIFIVINIAKAEIPWEDFEKQEIPQFNLPESCIKIPVLVNLSDYRSYVYFKNNTDLKILNLFDINNDGKNDFLVYLTNTYNEENLSYLVNASRSAYISYNKYNVCKNIPINSMFYGIPKDLSLKDFGIPENYDTLEIYDSPCDEGGKVLPFDREAPDILWITIPPLNKSERVISVRYEISERAVNAVNSCYYNNNNLTCFSDDNLEDDNFIGLTQIDHLLTSYRIDGYVNKVNFSIKDSNITFCPLSLDLGKWPEYQIVLYEINAGLANKLFGIVKANIAENITDLHLSEFVTGDKEFYDKFIIIRGGNITLILTAPQKPSVPPTGSLYDLYHFYNDSKNNYFFRLQKTDGETRASVCTNDSSDYSGILEGPKFYLTQLNFSNKELVELGFVLSHPLIGEIRVVENIVNLTVRGLINNQIYISPSIAPRIILKNINNLPFENYTIFWYDGGDIRNQSFNGEEIDFENYVDINGTHFINSFDIEKFLYPFDSYDGTIWVKHPPYFENDPPRNIQVGGEEGNFYSGSVVFEDNKITFKIYVPLYRYIFLIIFFVIVSCMFYVSKNRNIGFKLSSIFLTIFIDYLTQVVPVSRILSIATLIYLVLAICILFYPDIKRLLNKRKKNTTSSQSSNEASIVPSSFFGNILRNYTKMSY